LTSIQKTNRHLDKFDRFNALVHWHGSKIVFLEIPPYSIVRWNSAKGHRTPNHFISQDKVLSHRLALANERIQEVHYRNSVASPRFRLAVLRCHSSKRGKRHTVNYNLYIDGVHPSVTMCRYWLRNILTAINRHCY